MLQFASNQPPADDGRRCLRTRTGCRNGIRSAGLESYAKLLTLAPCRYLPRLTLSAVLPFPNMS